MWKIHKAIVALFLAATVTDLYWLDSDGDKTKSILVIEYSDGKADRLVVSKRELNSGHLSKIVEEAARIMDRRTGN